MAWGNCQPLEIKKRNWVWGFFWNVCVLIRILKEILGCLFPKWHCPLFAKGLYRRKTLSGFAVCLPFLLLTLTGKGSLHAHLLKSLVKILGIFVSSYSYSVWEAGPFSLSPSFLSSHCLHCYSSWTFLGHSQAGSASPMTHISVPCPEMKLSQGLWKVQTALGGWVNPLHWTFSLVTGEMWT